MKKGLLIALALIAFKAGFTTIHTVSNDVYLPAQFSTVQAAHDAATAGDTILVKGTGLAYGALVVNKMIHIFGDSGLPGEGGQINTLTISGNGASNSTFQSLRIPVLNSSIQANEAINGVQFRRCHIGQVGLATSGTGTYAYWLFEGNVFYENAPAQSFYINDNQDILDFSIFRYNIFNSAITGIQNSLFDHNIFNALDPNNVFLNDIYYTTFSNNIFYGLSTSNGQYCQFNVYNNNISFGGSNTTFPIGISNNSGSGNIQNSDPMFTNAPINQAFSPLFDYTPMAGSPALDAGTDELSIGPVTNTNVFRHDSEPDIPVVRSVIIPGGNTVPAEGTFQITVNSVSHP